MPRFDAHPARRAAVVTGGSSGIGAATARALGALGHPVVVGARRVDRCEAVAAAIRDAGGVAHAAGLDLRDPSSVSAFASDAERLVGPPDVVVLAAGRSQPDCGDCVFTELMDVNFFGPRRLVGAILPAMVARGRGDVVFVGSEVVRAPRPLTSAYVASKWAIEGYARTLQMELEGTGVRASIVQPGQTDSEMGHDWDADATGRILDEWARWGLARHPHFLDPAAVASAIVHVVAAPPGVHLRVVEVEPEAPIRTHPKGAT